MQIDLREFESLQSTNDYLINELKQGTYKKELLTVCVAKEQTKARGQFNRNWYAPKGENLYLSALYTINTELDNITPTTFTTCIVKTLQDFGITKLLTIKHPNDILYNNKKIAGILVETFKHQNNNTSSIIVGIGLNINMTCDPKKQISQPWTSIKLVLNQTQDIEKVKINLIDNLVEVIQSHPPGSASWLGGGKHISKEFVSF